jgi:hypothetical protein
MESGDLLLFFGLTKVVIVVMYLITQCNLQMQLHELMETLSSTEPHYIRCIKPNSVLKPAIFENTNVLQQLRCSVRNIMHILSLNFYVSSAMVLFDNGFPPQ